METAAAPEYHKPGGRRRRIVIAVVIAVVALVLLVAARIGFREHAAYNLDVASCYSDNMFMLQRGLEEFVAEHDGRMPATFDELRAYMNEKKGGPYDICVRADAPFVWMPEGVTTDDGCSVVLMCPPNSHGWLRKYAVGLIRDGDQFEFVRVRNGRAVRFR